MKTMRRATGHDGKSYTPEYKEALALLMMARTTDTRAMISSSLEKPNTKYQDEFVFWNLKTAPWAWTMRICTVLCFVCRLPSLIRCGVFNERDERGYPVAYPFTEIPPDMGMLLP